MRSRCEPIAVSGVIGSVRDWPCTSWPFKPSAFGGKNREITLEPVAEATNALAWTIRQRTWRSPDEIAGRCLYYRARNRASYESRKRKAKLRAQNTGDK